MINFKPNDAAAYEFMQAMMQAKAEKDKKRVLFTDFIIENGYSTWHIHDGWVMDMKWNSGRVLDKNDKIRLTWISEHAGYSHSRTLPKVGGNMAIIDRSPGSEETVFIVYSYTVEQVGERRYVLSLYEKKQATFSDGKYHWYIAPPTFWERFKNNAKRFIPWHL